jgi:hypothetical protein
MRVNGKSGWFENQFARKDIFRLPLPKETKLGLANGETCYFSGPMAVWTKHSHIVRVGGYAGPSFRVARGVSFRAGGFKSMPITTTGYEEDDRGTHCITTQRIVFAGLSTTKVIKLRDVIDSKAFSDGDPIRYRQQEFHYFQGREWTVGCDHFLAGAGGLCRHDTVFYHRRREHPHLNDRG